MVVSVQIAPPDFDRMFGALADHTRRRSEEHTSELQSQSNLVCRLLLEKKKKYPQKPSRSKAVYLYYPSNTSLQSALVLSPRRVLRKAQFYYLPHQILVLSTPPLRITLL